MSDGQDSRRYELGDGIELFPAADHLIAVDSQRDAVHHLNQTAALILRNCDGRTAAEICSHVSEEYPDVPMERLATDISRTLEELEDKGVVRTTAAGG